MNQIPFGQTQAPRDAHFTGQNIHATAGSRTPLNANLRRGDVLQLDPFDHDNAKGVSPTVNQGGLYVCAVATATFKTPLVVVTDEPAPQVNDIQVTATGLRRGGRIKVAAKGLVQARVTTGLALVAGVTHLAIDTASRLLVLCNASTVAHMLLRVAASGGAAKPCAVAMETKTTSEPSTGAGDLTWVMLLSDEQ